MASIAKHTIRRYLVDEAGGKILDPDTGKARWEPAGEVWRARYRDAAGKHHVRHFDRQIDGKRWLDEVTAAVVTGQYVDPKAGRLTFREYAETWRVNQAHRPGTQDQVERHLRRHVYPSIGDRPLASILPSDLKAMLKRLEPDLSPATVSVVYRHVSTILKAAVLDRRLASSPCAGVSVPKPRKVRVEPISTDTFRAIVDAVPERYRALVILAAGTGLRQGEAFGLTLDRVDFLRRRVTVDRQLTTVSGRAPEFGPPKTAAGVRVVPLPSVVGDALATHLATFRVGADGLIFTNEIGAPLRRSAFNTSWRRATRDAGAPGVVFHSLRHYYASLLIRHGESVKVVQERLGHASAVETLDTYSHLWPDSDDRTREAVDEALGMPVSAPSRTSGGILAYFPRTRGAS